MQDTIVSYYDTQFNLIKQVELIKLETLFCDSCVSFTNQRGIGAREKLNYALDTHAAGDYTESSLKHKQFFVNFSFHSWDFHLMSQIDLTASYWIFLNIFHTKLFTILQIFI